MGIEILPLWGAEYRIRRYSNLQEVREQQTGREEAMNQMFYARTSDHGYETCVEHLTMTGCLAGGFARHFDRMNDGLAAGMFHDLGKYSQAFQNRITHPEQTGQVDHSTAGAMLLMQGDSGRLEAAMAVAGHHAGLSDYGAPGDLSEQSTFQHRLQRASNPPTGHVTLLDECAAWKNQLPTPPVRSTDKTNVDTGKPALYTAMMLTRMLLSAVVDGDRLDAEFFTHDRTLRTEHDLLSHLKQYLATSGLTSQQSPDWKMLCEAAEAVYDERADNAHRVFTTLETQLSHEVQGYFDSPKKSPLNAKRCELLQRCIDLGRDPTCTPGLYTLTAPTGSGKTLASVAFAVEHALTQRMQRIIYVIPFTSIIDQTSRKFEQLFGPQMVLPHYAEAPYQLKNEADMDKTDLRRVLAAENWNAPIVVTTAVQFFESLYSNTTSKCRKLHNIANSIIIFDEAQTLPAPYLRPCVQAIAELVRHYGVTAVLCTATQPELLPLFRKSYENPTLTIPEISPFTAADSGVFARTTVSWIGAIELDALADRLRSHHQALCVVNTRHEAQYLYGQLCADSEASGNYCLTTLQCAADRQRLLNDIRTRLLADEPCRVVSTSLIEAGVDVDFQVAYREETGLDSILQTAGRCNREGKRPSDQSTVFVFSTGAGTPPTFRQNVKAFQAVLRHRSDNLASDEAIHNYFTRLLNMRTSDSFDADRTARDALDIKGILAAHGFNGINGCLMPFKQIAERFKLIDAPTIPVYVPINDEAQALCERLLNDDVDRNLFRKLGRYAVNIWSKHLETLQSAGAVLSPPRTVTNTDETCFVLRDMSLYTAERGLSLTTEPEGIFI